MNHDATHCLDYNEETCPKSCYRAQLTKEYNEIVDYDLPVSWAHYGPTNECPMNGTVTAKINKSSTWIGTPCLICGESVPIENDLSPKICDKCKAAVMHVRAEMESHDKVAFDRLMMGVHHE